LDCCAKHGAKKTAQARAETEKVDMNFILDLRVNHVAAGLPAPV
jgi:hypothetical protein